jgi:Holliday junction DNA helicase RuvB
MNGMLELKTKDHFSLENALRPKKLEEFVGQQKLVSNLKVFVEATAQRHEPLEHVLLHGGPGLGKTTLAHILGNELGVHVHATTGPTLERAGDLAAILTNLSPRDILFIDEIHRLRKTGEEMLYKAMEEFSLPLIIGKGPSAKMLKVELPPFTLVGATTKINMLSAPLRDRFGMTFHLDYYEEDEICRIIKRSSQILNFSIPEAALQEIAKRARRTPRVANRLLKRVRDYVEVEKIKEITPEVIRQTLSKLEIDNLGLDATDRRILETLINKFRGGPVGLKTIAAATGEELETIENIYEPYLLQLGFLERTPRGRTATAMAYKHLNIGTRDWGLGTSSLLTPNP